MPHNQSMDYFVQGAMFLITVFILLPLVMILGLFLWSVMGMWAFPAFVFVAFYAWVLFTEKVERKLED